MSIRDRTDRFTELTIARLQTGNLNPCLQDGVEITTELLGPEPRDLVRYLQSRPEVRVGTPMAVNVAGVSGVRFDLEMAMTLAELCGADAIVPGDRLQLFFLGDDTAWIRPGQKLRVWALDAGDQTVTILAGVPESTFQSVITQRIDPIVDSLRFVAGPPGEPRDLAPPSASLPVEAA